MSTDTKQDGEEYRLPATWEEYQRERRKVWLDCAAWIFSRGKVAIAGTQEESARRYPITKRVPRVLSDGRCEWRMVAGELEYRLANLTWQRVGYNADRVRLFADLLANPTEEVES